MYTICFTYSWETSGETGARDEYFVLCRDNRIPGTDTKKDPK